MPSRRRRSPRPSRRLVRGVTGSWSHLRAGTDDRYLPLMAKLDLVPLSAEPWMPGMALHPLPAHGDGADRRPGTRSDG